MIKERRRAAKLEERLTHCLTCSYPLSHRHHLLPFAEYGEGTLTIQLCANCHELYHIVQKMQLLHCYNSAQLLKDWNHPKQRNLQVYIDIFEKVNKKMLEFFYDLAEGVDHLKYYIRKDGLIARGCEEKALECARSLDNIIEEWANGRK